MTSATHQRGRTSPEPDPGDDTDPDPSSGADASVPIRLAAFDFDGTLSTRDSVVPFIRRFVAPKAFVRLMAAVPRLVPTLARRDRDRFREIGTMVVFGGLEYPKVVEVAESYGAELLKSGLRTDTVDRLRQHVADGDRVVLVSASYREYLEPIARELGVESVIATTLEVANGMCTGGLVDGNCRGPEKVRRLEAWLSSQGLERHQVHVAAYGDSSGDAEMLAWADVPHWVGSSAQNDGGAQ